MTDVPTVDINDLAAIEALISDEFGAWGKQVVVTQEMINQFAELTGDHQWIHVDVERAKKQSPFGGPIAHGFLTLSLLPSIMPMTMIPSGIVGAVNYGAESLRFLSPVPAGATVHCATRLVAAVERPQGVLVTTEAKVQVVDAPKPALLYKMQVLYLKG